MVKSRCRKKERAGIELRIKAEEKGVWEMALTNSLLWWSRRDMMEEGVKARAGVAQDRGERGRGKSRRGRE
jgi:hypothetical protein